LKGARRVREAARENGTVPTTVTASRADFHRPPTQEIVAFIDDNRDELGVEPICTVLRSAGVLVAPSSYYAAKNRQPSARAQRDAQMIPVLEQLWGTTNYRVYGARKLWKAARRAGHDLGRDQVSRLMRVAGIEGARRTKRIRTTRPIPGAPWHPDLVERDFTASAPNQLWVTDLTFVATFAGIAYVCFIVDAYSRMIVGWRVASHMRTTMVLDAIEMARWSRGKRLAGLRCHSDAGSQFTSIRCGGRLAEIGAVPSIGTVGDSFDNALAERVNGYYKTELIRGPTRTGPWRTVDDVGLATLGWVPWHNTSRLHGYLHDQPPAEFEAIFYETDRPTPGRNPIARASSRTLPEPRRFRVDQRQLPGSMSWSRGVTAPRPDIHRTHTRPARAPCSETPRVLSA
jgi:putative transposase